MKTYLFLLAALLGAQLLFGQYYNDFESWPNTAGGSWSMPGPGGMYHGSGVYVNFGNASSGLQKIGFNGTGDAIELPPVTNPAYVAFAARTSSGSSAAIGVQYYDGSSWVSAGGALVGGPSYQGYTFSVDFAGENVPLQIVMLEYGNSIFLDDLVVTTFYLPVELTEFLAQPARDGVELRWRTLTESANERFELERSKDGMHFSRLAVIPGAGNSLLPIDYSWFDSEPRAGLNYYRLRQVDWDGTESYSPVVSAAVAPRQGWVLQSTMVSASLVLLPNPDFPGELLFRLMDLQGRLLRQYRIPPGSFSSELDVSDLRPGPYLLMDRQGLGQRFLKF